jgi:hypothetical protein
MPGPRLAAATLLAVLACGVSSSGQPAPASTPVVAIVLTDGKLLPLATFRAGADWQMLAWPRHALREPQPAPPLPATTAMIPREWFAPLTALPSLWRMQPINGARSAIHAAVPTRWQVATFDAVGLATDYVDPDPTQRSFDFNAGIAVAGDIDTLPVRELDEASPEWAHLVARHVKAFVAADRTEAKQRGEHLKGRTSANTTKDLRAGDVSLYRIDVEPKRAYEYFEVTVQRPAAAGASRPACQTPTVEYHGMIELHGRTELVRWLSSTGPACGATDAVMEVVGGLRGAGGVRLVVEYSSDRAQSFAVINPLLPESEIRREPRLAAPPLLH